MGIQKKEIVNDLCNLSENEFYLKYIVKSYIWYFEQYQQLPSHQVMEKIDCFKEIISQSFDVSFHSAQIVGSAKLGVSLAPKKHLRDFIVEASNENEKESDIDIAIVSDKLFHDMWDKLRKAKNETVIPRYKMLVSSVFNGYINDKDFKDIDAKVRREWSEKVSESNKKLQGNLSILHPISYRIYRSWEDMEDYQMRGIRELKEVLSKNEIQV